MDLDGAGLVNLAEFVAATAGRNGEVVRVPGGIAVASPFPMAHGFVTAGFLTDPAVDPDTFLDAASRFYEERGRAWVVWVGEHQPDLRRAVTARGGHLDGAGSPAMVARGPVTEPPGFTVAEVADAEAGAVFAALAEAGYEIPGLAWLMGEHDAFGAAGTSWLLATPDDDPAAGPVSVAAGFLHDGWGGVYYVATPPEHRGRGAAAAVTAAVTNQLFAAGVEGVTLQATDLGHPVYLRLGYQDYARFWSCELNTQPT